MYLGQQQDHAGSPAKNSTQTDQPQRKPVGRWCLTNHQRVMTRSRRLADRSCCRDATLEAGWQKSIRYCGAWPCMQLNIIISLNDCWSCMACYRCYWLGYQISAAVPYTALYHSPIQCNVETARMFNMFMCLLIYLPPLYPSHLARQLWFITLTLLLDQMY